MATFSHTCLFVNQCMNMCIACCTTLVWWHARSRGLRQQDWKWITVCTCLAVTHRGQYSRLGERRESPSLDSVVIQVAVQLQQLPHAVAHRQGVGHQVDVEDSLHQEPGRHSNTPTHTFKSQSLMVLSKLSQLPFRDGVAVGVGAFLGFPGRHGSSPKISRNDRQRGTGSGCVGWTDVS